MLAIDSTTLRLPPHKYLRDVTRKVQLYLHHTVGGSAESTVAYWTSHRDRIGTSYIVARDGTVYEVFDPHYWAFHLGLTDATVNHQANAWSIGIELASEGALRSGEELNIRLARASESSRFDPTLLYAFDIDPKPQDPPSSWFRRATPLYHLTGQDRDKFVELSEPFRGYRFFDAYDPLQTAAVIELVVYLCKQFPSIPKRLLSESSRTVFDRDLVAKFRGILGHCNVRSDKSDVHPKFPWAQLEMRLQADAPLEEGPS
jgi:N-acetyl-anhydromuramyl-L-alanine amidase AmpD